MPICRYSTYFIITQNINQQTALTRCNEQNGIIASFHNYNEYKQAAYLCKYYYNTVNNMPNGCWTGIKDDIIENKFYNQDGSSLDYLLNSDGTPKTGQYPWKSGQPNNWGTNGQDCVQIDGSYNYELGDSSCSTTLMAICRKSPSLDISKLILLSYTFIIFIYIYISIMSKT